MKSTALIASLLTTLVVAGPVKRAIVTEYETKVVTVTVTAGKPPTTSSDTVKIVPTTSEPVQVVPTSFPTTAVVIKPVPTTTSSIVPSAAPSPDKDIYKGLSAYARPILEQHNIHRANHSVPDMAWNETLVGFAKEIAETCVYKHQNFAGDGKYGQNIGAGAPDEDIPKMITNSMYNGEILAYPGPYGSEPNMGNFHVWGHYSQIVWKSTTSVGCYTKKCDVLGETGKGVRPFFTVCNYFPPGNFGGQYGKNVLKPLGQKAVIL